MIIGHVTVTTRPERTADFLAAASELARESVQEAGCLEYRVFQDPADLAVVFVVERWRDQGALDFHGQSPHMAAFQQAVKGCVATRPVSAKYEAADAAAPAG
jgi:quinol monooxygenase YgiN